MGRGDADALGAQRRLQVDQTRRPQARRRRVLGDDDGLHQRRPPREGGRALLPDAARRRPPGRPRVQPRAAGVQAVREPQGRRQARGRHRRPRRLARAESGADHERPKEGPSRCLGGRCEEAGPTRAEKAVKIQSVLFPRSFFSREIMPLIDPSDALAQMIRGASSHLSMRSRRLNLRWVPSIPSNLRTHGGRGSQRRGD
mmetsp:Transcript_23648/g.93775  ORF Transcript_23648/g.93775 Transcript_23648/m.93775 type:complete len:200 (+) Transcript_23648:1439-2038(+)